MPRILDACCGSKMFWFDTSRHATVFMDNRELDTELCDGRRLVIKPDVVADFRDMPFPDETFALVVFDPPHLVSAGAKSWLALKYGVLGKDWREDLRKGFAECFRVLKPDGVLVFKWSEYQVPLKDILALTDEKPLFGERRGKTHWMIFIKGGADNERD